MGRILLVHDQYLGREIALKELLPESKNPDGDVSPMRQSATMLGRFLQEARITGQLEHPSIIPVYELGYRPDGTLYYTMKLVRGKTLAQALGTAASLTQRLALLPHFVDLCQAVAYAHSRRVLHRDLKPDNVMVGEFGETVVIDWGLAKVRDQRDVHADGIRETIRAMQRSTKVDVADTSYGHALGTPAYMPPEQAKGQLESVDERSDVYSLGAILYELLTGQPPFAGPTVQEVLDAVIEGKPRTVVSLEPKAPQELVAICEKAMQKDADDRYEKAQELAAEVQRFQSGAPVHAYAYQFSEHFRRFVLKHKALLATCATAFAVLLVSGTYYNLRLLQSREAERAARIHAEQQRRIAESQRDQIEYSQYVANIQVAADAMERGDPGSARAALEAAPERHRNWEWGYLANQAWPEVPSIRSTSGEIRPTASVSSAAAIWRGCSAQVVLTLPTRAIRTACFDPSARRLLTVNVDGLATVWDAHAGTKLIELPQTSRVMAAAYNPGGTLILTTHEDDLGRLWDAATGRMIDTLPGLAGMELQFASDDSRVAAMRPDDGLIDVWAISQRQKLFTLAMSGDSDQILLRMNTEKDCMFVASHNSNVTTYSLQSGAEIRTVSGPKTGQAIVSGIRPDGRCIASVDSTGNLLMWDAESGQELSSLRGDFRHIVDFSVDGTCATLVSGAGEIGPQESQSLQIVDTVTGERLARVSGFVGLRRQYYRGHGPAARFSNDGSRIVLVHDGGTCVILAPVVVDPLRPNVLPGHANAVLHIAQSKDGTCFVTGSLDGTAIVWDVASRTQRTVLKGHQAGILFLNLSPDDATVLTVSWDRTARLWNATTGEEIAVYDIGWPPPSWNGGFSSPLVAKHAALVDQTRFSPDGKRCAVPRRDSILVVDTVSGAVLQKLICEGSDGLYGGGYSADGNFILGYSYTGKARVWDARTGAIRYTLDQTTFHCRFSESGRYLLNAAVEATGPTVGLRDAATGKRLSQNGLTVDTFAYYAAFDPRERFIITENRVLDAKSGRCIYDKPLDDIETFILDRHAFSPDGYRILNKNLNGGVQLCDLHGSRLLTLGCAGQVLQARWMNDGASILTSSSVSLTPQDPNEIRFWDAIPWKELAELDDGSMPVEERIHRWREAAARKPATISISANY